MTKNKTGTGATFSNSEPHYINLREKSEKKRRARSKCQVIKIFLWLSTAATAIIAITFRYFITPHFEKKKGLEIERMWAT